MNLKLYYKSHTKTKNDHYITMSYDSKCTVPVLIIPIWSLSQFISSTCNAPLHTLTFNRPPLHHICDPTTARQYCMRPPPITIYLTLYNVFLPHSSISTMRRGQALTFKLHHGALATAPFPPSCRPDRLTYLSIGSQRDVLRRLLPCLSFLAPTPFNLAPGPTQTLDLFSAIQTTAPNNVLFYPPLSSQSSYTLSDQSQVFPHTLVHARRFDVSNSSIPCVHSRPNAITQRPRHRTVLILVGYIKTTQLSSRALPLNRDVLKLLIISQAANTIRHYCGPNKYFLTTARGRASLKVWGQVFHK